ncbi:MAG TPA: alpha-2-macroglobulin family protein, partial [Gemmataceae bacterium]|nr:alpha-2-macroglobulin family protein [Gemmataceae bacterium]
MADEKTYRSMPTQFLLTNEVRHPEDLEFADFLLSPKDKARQALDLLLGTQGWRRFAEQDPVKFRNENKDKDATEVERLVSAFGQSQPIQTDLQINQVNQVRQGYVEAAQHIDEVQARTTERRHAATADVGYLAAIAKLAKYRAFFNSVNHWIFPGLGVLLLAGTAVSVLVGLRREGRRALPYFATGIVCALVLVVVGLEIILGSNTGQPIAAGSQPGNLEVATAKDAPTAAAPRGNEGIKADGKDRFAGKAPPWDALNKTGQPVDPKSASQPVSDRAEKPAAATASVAPAALPAGPEPANPQGAGRVFHGPMAMKDTKTPAGGLENLDKNRGGEKDREQRKLEMHYDMPAGQNGLDQRKADALAKEGDFKRVNEDFEQHRKPTPPIGIANGGRGGFPGGGGFGGGPMPMPMAQPPGEPGGKPVEGKKQMFAAMRPQPPPVVVREYRHTRAASLNTGIREDFAETLYWHPVLLLANGKAEASFDLCDSVTTFQATAFAHTLDGRLGAATATFDARLPFTLEPKVPVEVTSSDKIDIPLSIANNGNGREKVNVQVAGMSGLSLLRGKAAADYELPAGQQMRQVYRFQPTVKEGRAILTFAGQSGAFTDNTRNSFAIVPEGFPVVGSFSDLLERTAAQTVTLPQQWVAGTLKMQVDVYPSTLADLQKGLDSLLREPNGCFEQTSTSNYPNLLILDYLKESDQTKPDVERRARDLLARGYLKLKSFECTNEVKKVQEGYEWFGGTAPAHEALTAYGLLQFRDMARVQEVDQQMMERTKQYLLSRRDGKGGFTRNPRALDTFGRAPDDITNAYIVWSLTESGKDDDLTAELDALIKIAESSKDPYFLSLVANGLINRDRRPVAATLLKKVADCQKDDGHLDAERTSITGSGGRDLQIETTALAVLGWLKLNSPGEFTAPVQKAVKWLGQQRGGYGGFGSTQSTILALKALIAYTKENKRTVTAGELKLYVNEREVSKLPFAAGASETLSLSVPNAEAVLRPGPNKIRVEITGRNTFPYTLRWNYSTLQPVSAEN